MRVLRFLMPLLAVLLVLTGTTVPASAAAPDVWARWAGPGTWIRSLDYVTPTQLVAGGENDGVFTATNAVGPWKDISGNLPAGGKHVRQAVGESGQIYLATSAGLFRGTGTGDSPTWQQLGVSASTPADQRLNQGGVQSIVFPTGQPTSLVVATSGSGRDGVFWSSDSGKTWKRATGLTSGTYHLTGDETVMWASAASGFYKSTDGGRSWTLRSDGIPGGDTPLRVSISPLTDQQLFAATAGGVFRSDNGGTTWYDASGSGDGSLDGGTVRAFQLVPSSYWADGVPRMVAGTAHGVWATLDGGESWAELSSSKAVGDGLAMGDEVVWALALGFGAPGSLVAGTQRAVFALPLQLAEAPASVPAPSGSAVVNAVLTANTGVWGGTAPFFFSYQWKRCTQSSGVNPSGSTCSPIPGATARTYQAAAGDVGSHLRVGVRARGLVQPVWSAEKLSASVVPVVAPPGAEPIPPSGYPQLQGNNVSQPWGGTLTVVPSDASGKWRQNGTPMTTTYAYRWSRCETNGTGCVLLDHMGPSYTTTVADSGHVVQARVIGTIGQTSSDERFAGQSGSIYEPKPTVVTPPLVVGPAHLGLRLQSTAGSWTGTAPSFTRRWLRCNAQGVQCAPTSPVVTTPSYQLRPADRGHTFRIEVTATVEDQFQDRVTTVQSARSAVVDYSPSCLRARTGVTRAQRALAAAQRSLRQARQSGNRVKIKRAKKRVATATTSLRRARAAATKAC